jgi:hypothetical protein
VDDYSRKLQKKERNPKKDMKNKFKKKHPSLFFSTNLNQVQKFWRFFFEFFRLKITNVSSFSYCEFLFSVFGEYIASKKNRAGRN